MTCTVVGWLPVFTRPQTVQIIFDSWSYLRENRGFVLYGYVILENHLHLIASADDLSDVMGDFKSYTARQIIDLLEARHVKMLLDLMRWFKRRHKTDREYQFWEEGSHPEQIQNDEMMQQKLDYMHRNPVERGYVDDPTHWRYSSARNYAGTPGVFPVVTDWR